MNKEKTLKTSAAKTGMCEKTARKYRETGKLPSQRKPVHNRPTHEDAFRADQSWAEEFLKNTLVLGTKRRSRPFRVKNQPNTRMGNCVNSVDA